jgi:hypothetical protein
MRTHLIDWWDDLPPAARAALRGAMTAALNGGAAATGAVMIDPTHFNRDELRHVALMFGMGALVGVLNWLRSSPWQSAANDVQSIHLK